MTRFFPLTSLLLFQVSPTHAAQTGVTAEMVQLLGAGIFFGILAGTALLNLSAWLTTRRPLYGLFSLFVGVSALNWALLDGLMGVFLPTADARLTTDLSQMLLGSQSVTGSLCQIAFLSLRRRFRPLFHYYVWGGVLPGFLVMLSPWTGLFEFSSQLLFALLLPAPLVSFPAYRALWRESEASSRILAVILPLHFFIMWPAIFGHLGFIAFDLIFLHVARISALPIIFALHTGIALQTRTIERARDEAQHQATEALARSERERLARQEQERFLSMITHEVRTPVAVIDAAAHSLRLIDQLGNGDPAQRESRYQAIRQAVGRMRTLMELTETEERLSIGSPLGNPAPLDLPAISEQSLACFEPAATARIRIGTTPPLPKAQGDARLLMFAFINLIDNALKYSAPGTPIQVGIAADVSGSGVCWRIRNDGPGIPAGKEALIFEKYHRLDETSAQPGLGLGLSISRQIVERHGGCLSLERNDPALSGACFCIWLPEAP